MIFDTCFFCDHYYHRDPDTDACDTDGHEVFFDTPKCFQFAPATTKERPVVSLFKNTLASLTDFRTPLDPDSS